MKPRLLKSGLQWRSDDAADIILGESSVTDTVYVAPTTFNVLSYSQREGWMLPVSLSDLEFIAYGRNDSIPGRRFGVYLSNADDRIVLFDTVGQNTVALILPLTATEAWKTAFYDMKPEQVWHICQSVMSLYRASMKGGKAIAPTTN